MRQVAAQAQGTKKVTSGVHIEGVEKRTDQIRQVLQSFAGRRLIGFITKGNGVSVHKKDCNNVISGLAKRDEDKPWLG